MTIGPVAFEMSEIVILPSFKVNGQLVLGKKIFKVFTIYGHGGHIGHVTLRVCIIFIPSAQGGSKRNLVTFGPEGYRRSWRLKIFLFLALAAILFI